MRPVARLDCGTRLLGSRVSQLNLEQRLAGSPILGYAFSVVAVAVALGLSLLFSTTGFKDTELPLFTIAIAFVTWFAARGPSVLTVGLSALCFNYFFTDPRYSLYVSVSEIPSYLIFVAWALIIAIFADVRRRAERDLLEARDHLQAANQELESLRLLGVARSAGAAAPQRELCGVVETAGIPGAGREESALPRHDPGRVQANGLADRRSPRVLEDRASRNQDDDGRARSADRRSGDRATARCR